MNENSKTHQCDGVDNVKTGRTIFTLIAWGIICVCILAAFICILWGYEEWQKGLVAFGKKDSQLGDLANLGSFLQGSTASLWALAGVFIIFVAFLIQAIQLADQRKQFKIQSVGISRQNFENKFFQLLNLHHKLVEDMMDGSNHGRDCFRKWYVDQLTRDYHSKKNPLMLSGGVPKYAPVRELEFTIERYQNLYDGLQGDLGHYFRNLYHLIKFVDESQDIENEFKKNYTTLVRAQLSAYEQALLFYNCIHPHSEEFYLLIEKYSLFHNLNEEILLDPSHEDYFDPKAYGNSKKVIKPNPRLVKIRLSSSESNPP